MFKLKNINENFIFYFLGQKEKAADVWNNYLVKQRLINIKPILQLSKNVDTLVQLTEFLDTHPNVNAETKRDANVALLCLYRMYYCSL